MNTSHRRSRHHVHGQRLPRRVIRFAVVGVATGGMVIAATGIGLAYWSSQGSGTGSATTGTATISLPTTAATVSGLYPGAQVTGVTVVVTNSSTAASVVLTGATGGTASISTAGPLSTGTTCDPSVVTFIATDVPGGAIAAGQTATVTGTVSMGTSAGNQCQGATFSIPITVTGRAG